MIKEKYPETTDARIDEVINDGRLDHLEIGGETYYFDQFMNTLYHIYPDFRTQEEAGALGEDGEKYLILCHHTCMKRITCPLTRLFQAR